MLHSGSLLLLSSQLAYFPATNVSRSGRESVSEVKKFNLQVIIDAGKFPPEALWPLTESCGALRF